jgi:hypothetical protein
MRHPVRSLRVALCFSGCLNASCSLDRLAPSPSPTATLVVAFWDLSGSISIAERRRWRSELLARTEKLGETLWDDNLSDCVVVLPLHGATTTATPLADECFPGGEYADNERRKRRAAFLVELESIDTVQVNREVRNDTDILAGIPRALEFGDPDSILLNLMFFSDMFHSVRASLNFERQGVVTEENASALAQEVASSRHWTGATLRGAEIDVYLPGTVVGATTNTDASQIAAIKLFWVELFQHLGGRIVSWRRF